TELGKAARFPGAVEVLAQRQDDDVRLPRCRNGRLHTIGNIADPGMRRFQRRPNRDHVLFLAARPPRAELGKGVVGKGADQRYSASVLRYWENAPFVLEQDDRPLGNAPRFGAV